MSKIKYKHIEAARETRMWIKDIFVPLAGFATSIILLSPSIKKSIAERLEPKD